jgi:hypothetical protein
MDLPASGRTRGARRVKAVHAQGRRGLSRLARPSSRHGSRPDGATRTAAGGSPHPHGEARIAS